MPQHDHCCCPHTTVTNNDEVIIVQDFGPEGTAAPVSVNLIHGLKPGGIVNAVVKTDVDMAVNIKDAKDNILIHAVARVSRDIFAVNSFLEGAWGLELGIGPAPVQKGLKFVISLVYEQAGYRVFVNGAEVSFYEHRSSEPPVVAEINGGVAYKLVYMSLVEVPK